MRDINRINGNALVLYRCNSVLSTVRTLRQRSFKGLVVCNDWDLEPLDLLNDLALDCYKPSPEVCLIQIHSFGKISEYYFHFDFDKALTTFRSNHQK